MRFPFEIESYSCNAFAANQELYIYDDVQGGDFWVKTYDSAGDAFEYVNEMLQNEGYILQFPSAFSGKEVIFASPEKPSLQNMSESALFLSLGVYTLLANLTVANLTVAAVAGNRYYIYNPATNNFALLANGTTATIMPFEAFVAVKDIADENLRTSLNIDAVTGIIQPADAVNDPVIKVQY